MFYKNGVPQYGDAAIAEVKSGKTFYAVGSGQKTGTMPTKAVVAASDLYEAGYHAGNAGGLDAIDTDLAPSKIKKGVTIFGKLGTFESSLAEDVLGEQGCTIAYTNSGTWRWYEYNLAQGAELQIASVTKTFAAGSRAAGVASISVAYAHAVKARLYMGGVLVAESAAVVDPNRTFIEAGTRALSGSQAVTAKLYKSGTTGNIAIAATSSLAGAKACGGVGVGSIKLV